MAVRSIAVVLAFVCATAAYAQVAPSALLSIDQNRATVIDRIMRDWGGSVAAANTGVDEAQLREILNGLRSDQLLAASLAGSAEGLRDVVASSLAHADAALPRSPVQTKALGDVAADVTYTPITPCRLIDTRGSFSPVYAGGPFTTNEIRTYTIQGGNGACLSQLPAGLNAAALQLQVFAMPTTSGSGDVEILPQGATFGSTATMVYVASLAFNTVSTSAKVNTSTNQISVQVRGGGANLAIDVVGYFKRPTNYTGTNTITGSGASVGGGARNTASGDVSTVAGGAGNTASGNYATVAGGTGNTAGGYFATVAGGGNNVASGFATFAAGTNVLADIAGCAVLGFFDTSHGNGVANCKGVDHIIRVMGDHGFTVDWGPATGNGGGVYWLEIGDLTAGKPINVHNGAYLSSGGAWVNSSDRNKKDHFAAIDTQDILNKVVALPVTQWNYKDEPGALRMGPVAQDFHAAFGLGFDDVTIATTDEAGVALAAIQGLNAKLEKLVGDQQREIDELRAMLAHGNALWLGRGVARDSP